jgi:predicted nucleic acid-binding protein
MNGPLTTLAQRVRVKDPEWHVPILWRSEMRSILTGYLRDGSLTRSQVSQVMHAAEGAFSGREHIVPSASVFEIAEKSRLSAYDCEFIVLASILDIPLVTADKAVLKAFPDVALTMEAFLNMDQSS